MAFLITGLPRTRTAWLAALFSIDDVECRHDVAVSFRSRRDAADWVHAKPGRGIADPAAACVWPDAAMDMFKGCQIVVIDRDAAESRRSFERWAGLSLSDSRFDQLAANFTRFKSHAQYALHIPHEWLSNDATVQTLFLHCTGRFLDPDRIAMFQRLRIEQHFDRAAERIPEHATV